MLGSNDATRGRGDRAPAPTLTTPMVALAWSILELGDADGEAGRVLARLILDEAQR
jgi:hypothetical protein